MNMRTRRWLLAPSRQWRTHRLMKQHGPSLAYPTAWALIALRHAPNEFFFAQQAVREAGVLDAPGVRHDDWSTLSGRERARRDHWLQRRQVSPIQRLGLDEEVIERAGLSVVDWGRRTEQSSRGE